jgi:L-ascorbate metabolism protein UlaG (beta-lactamase superfamily)
MKSVLQVIFGVMWGFIGLPASNLNFNAKSSLATELAEGEAVIWYLDHSGWAVKTKSRLLIFDYWERSKKPKKTSLGNGFVNPDEIKDLKVMVFVSHAHGDHNDPIILDWEKSVPDITYIYGWERPNESPRHLSCRYLREELTIDGVDIKTIVHDFDGIPESAFLVSVDGLVIFHSGDHGSGPPPFKDAYINNLEYLTRIAPVIDLAFIPLFGEEYYTAEQLKARYTFPMHSNVDQYKEFSRQAIDRELPTTVIPPLQRGHIFIYKNGKLK